MIHKNSEGYPDPVAGAAVREADKQPELVSWYIRMIRELAQIFDLEIVGYVHVRDKKTRRIW